METHPCCLSITAASQPRSALSIKKKKKKKKKKKALERTEKRVEQARTGERPRKPSSQAEQHHNVHSAGTLLLMADKSGGFVVAVLIHAVRMNDTPRSTMELPFSYSQSLNKGRRIAKLGSEHVDPISDLRSTHMGPVSWRSTTVK